MIPVPVSVAMGPDSIERAVNHRRDVQILQARGLDVASPSVLLAKGLTVGRARHSCRPGSIERSVNHRRDIQILQARGLAVASRVGIQRPGQLLISAFDPRPG